MDDTESFATLTARVDRRSLSVRQRQILELRTAGLTLATIGKELGISATRVRQIEARLSSLARRATLRAEIVAHGKAK
ncbi:MAG TPA: sigma factor-like helix-turn-helix DNA-binding protein [Candidatus Binataceae bacterium]|nr:sigma factor-like helix-turn-helix DNA-binding protein [Candidatus Binataceae bacterium]